MQQLIIIKSINITHVQTCWIPNKIFETLENLPKSPLKLMDTTVV